MTNIGIDTREDRMKDVRARSEENYNPMIVNPSTVPDEKRVKQLGDSGMTMDRRYPFQHQNSIMKIVDWRQKIMETLCLDKQIGKLLKYSTPDALDRPDLTEDESYDLINQNIFSYRYIPQTVETQKAFISLGISGFIPQESWRQFSQQFTMGYIWFYILNDISIMNTDYGDRRDLLLMRVYDLFQDSDDYGMGHIKEGNLTELFDQNNKFGGYVLQMKVIDLMR